MSRYDDISLEVLGPRTSVRGLKRRGGARAVVALRASVRDPDRHLRGNPALLVRRGAYDAFGDTGISF